MDNFKIYRNGHYSTIDNLKLKVKNQLPIICESIDNFFTNH